jgi:hypothetical protein
MCHKTLLQVWLGQVSRIFVHDNFFNLGPFLWFIGIMLDTKALDKTKLHSQGDNKEHCGGASSISNLPAHVSMVGLQIWHVV